MSYTSIAFWGLLAAVLAGVAALPQRWRGWWLLAGSLWFYAAPAPLRLLWIGAVAALVFGALARGRGHPSGRWPVPAMAIALLVLLLVWAKFADALGLPDPAAPPGLSFIVFTAIALIVDVTRQGGAPGLRDTMLHLAWFPKILAGPIERPGALVRQFATIRLTPDLAALGLSWLLVGLVKKLVIADSLAPTVDAAFAIPAHAPPAELLIAVYFFAFQIYCDFSGYADIAVGLSLLVGLRLVVNFDRPYLSSTVTEFWGLRWHISLARWFRDYVFIPLGGSRRGRFRRWFNLMTVFLLSGLWHAGLGYGVGWGFVIWGAMNGAFVCLETLLPAPRRQPARVLGAVVTFHLVLLTWVLFRAADPGDALVILRRIAEALPTVPTQLGHYALTSPQGLGAAMIAGLLAVEIATGARPLPERLTAAVLPLRWASWYALMGGLLLAGRWQDTTFIYAGF